MIIKQVCRVPINYMLLSGPIIIFIFYLSHHIFCLLNIFDLEFNSIIHIRPLTKIVVFRKFILNFRTNSLNLDQMSTRISYA